MKKVNLLSKAEMKKVLGGKTEPPVCVDQACFVDGGHAGTLLGNCVSDIQYGCVCKREMTIWFSDWCYAVS